jgi:hypothetical protein
MNSDCATLTDVCREELVYVAQRRKVNKTEEKGESRDNLFGIALSGGGIRSATMSAGFLEVLEGCGILLKADYLSTVSGGGFMGGYVQTRLHSRSEAKELFSREDLSRLCAYGQYLAPAYGSRPDRDEGDSDSFVARHGKLRKQLNNIRLVGAFAASLVMNWFWVALALLTFACGMAVVGSVFPSKALADFLLYVLIFGCFVLCVHYFLYYLRYYGLWSSDVLSVLEGIALCALGLAIVIQLCGNIVGTKYSPSDMLMAVACIFALVGLFGNPNMLSMHRFYRDRLAVAFLACGGRFGRWLRLHELNNLADNQVRCAPYPLINTCLNLVGADDRRFSGSSMSDYFLLSPAFVGSATTGYDRTWRYDYEKMSLATATAISGAAINPNMGTRTNRFLAFFMTLMNLELGYWAYNPGYDSSIRPVIVWWPYYHFLQLLCKTDSSRARINLSDGGQIENLGVFELLRRRCKLIIAFDAGADPHYGFADLRNLIIRARNDLGLIITFPPGQDPETLIRPAASKAYSSCNYAIASVRDAAPAKDATAQYSGTLVYVKSSILEPQALGSAEAGDAASKSLLYQQSHPSFPHESTADQFFDPDQWEAHYMLGSLIASHLIDGHRGRVRKGAPNISAMTRSELERFFRSQVGNTRHRHSQRVNRQ